MELWKPIPSSPQFAVSSEGHIYDRRDKVFVKPRVSPHGYVTVAVRGSNGRDVRKYVHTIVAEAFLGASYGRRISHVDGDLQNNRAVNLRWVLSSQLDNPTNSRKRAVKIVETGQVFDSIKECADAIAGAPNRVSNVLVGKRGTYKGYHFHYADKAA